MATSGALGTPWQTGSQAEWLDVAVLYREHDADLVRLALLLVGDRGSAG